MRAIIFYYRHFLIKWQILFLNGYNNDTAHIFVKEYRRCDYFRRAKKSFEIFFKKILALIKLKIRNASGNAKEKIDQIFIMR